MTSQILAIFYLSDIDHYIKEVLRYKYYIRYMDDLILLSIDKKRLIRDFDVIKNKIESEKLNINNKSRIYKLSDGFSFLGYKFLLNNDKLLIRYNNSTIKRIRRSLRGKKKSDYSLYYKSIRSYKGYLIRSNRKLKRVLLVIEKSLYDKYNNLKSDNKLSLIFIKSGLFYYTFDEDSLIMNYIFYYKIIDGKVGFPVKNIKNKVFNKLDNLNISYVILDGDEVKMNMFNDNEYVKYLGLSYDKYEKNECLNRIYDYINKLIDKDDKNYYVLESLLRKMTM